MVIIKNAAPQFIPLGIEDKSIRQLPVSSSTGPSHLPLFFIYAAKGRSDKTLLTASDALALYGSNTFDPGKKYYNHATRFLTTVMGTGNICRVARIIPEDAGVRANCSLWADVLECDVPNYLRNGDGSIVVDDELNSYKVDPDRPKIKGFKIKIIKEFVDKKENEIGRLKAKPGTMKDPDTGDISTMYPILEALAKYQGSYYNNIGFSFGSLYDEDADTVNIANNKAMMYRFQLVTRPDEVSSPVIFKNLFAEPSMNLTLKNKTVDATTNARLDVSNAIFTLYFNETNPDYSTVYNEYEAFHVYDTILADLGRKILEREKEFVTTDELKWADGSSRSPFAWYDYSTADKTEILEEGLILNLFTCKSTKDVRYRTLLPSNIPSELTKYQKEVSITSDTPIFLEGGSDGTMDNANFEKGVVAEIQKFLDVNSEVQSISNNPESIFYDSGFTVATKLKLPAFIARRKDTVLVLCTHDASLGEKEKPLSYQQAIAVALKTALKLTPESDHYGTPCARGMILSMTGTLRDGSSADRIPISLELAHKAATMMGSVTGWKKVAAFDTVPGSEFKLLSNVKPVFIPQGTKSALWNNGVVWAEINSDGAIVFPALQTVYDNDTSVLNSFFTVMAAAYCTKLANRAYEVFRGSIGLTDADFISSCTNFMVNAVTGKFADIIKVIPSVTITDDDAQRGFSWHASYKLGCNNMKSVMVYTTEAYRMADLA